MKFALMQPYFFPYIGYFALIHGVDHFMFFDDIQFIKKSWMTRNRLLNLSTGRPFYIRPELKNTVYKCSLPVVELNKNESWKLKLLGQLKGYKNKASFYNESMAFIKDILSQNFVSLAELNMSTTKSIARYLGLTTKIDKYSDYNFWFDEKLTSGDWGREVAVQVNASHYINAPGGESFIFPEAFEKQKIKLGFIQPELIPYNQGLNEFIPGLSILDVLMFNGRLATTNLLSKYSIKWTRQ